MSRTHDSWPAPMESVPPATSMGNVMSCIIFSKTVRRPVTQQPPDHRHLARQLYRLGNGTRVNEACFGDARAITGCQSILAQTHGGENLNDLRLSTRLRTGMLRNPFEETAAAGPTGRTRVMRRRGALRNATAHGGSGGREVAIPSSTIRLRWKLPPLTFALHRRSPPTRHGGETPWPQAALRGSCRTLQAAPWATNAASPPMHGCAAARPCRRRRHA